MSYNFEVIKDAVELRRVLEVAELFPEGKFSSRVENKKRVPNFAPGTNHKLASRYANITPTEVNSLIKKARILNNKQNQLPKTKDSLNIIEEYVQKAEEKKYYSREEQLSSSEERLNRSYKKARASKGLFSFLKIAAVVAGALLLPMLATTLVTGLVGAVLGSAVAASLTGVASIGLAITGGVAGHKLWGKLFQSRQLRAEKRMITLEDERENILDKKNDIKSRQFESSYELSRANEMYNDFHQLVENNESMERESESLSQKEAQTQQDNERILFIQNDAKEAIKTYNIEKYNQLEASNLNAGRIAGFKEIYKRYFGLIEKEQNIGTINSSLETVLATAKDEIDRSFSKYLSMTNEMDESNNIVKEHSSESENEQNIVSEVVSEPVETVAKPNDKNEIEQPIEPSEKDASPKELLETEKDEKQIEEQQLETPEAEVEVNDDKSADKSVKKQNNNKKNELENDSNEL